MIASKYCMAVVWQRVSCFSTGSPANLATLRFSLHWVASADGHVQVALRFVHALLQAAGCSFEGRLSCGLYAATICVHVKCSWFDAPAAQHAMHVLGGCRPCLPEGADDAYRSVDCHQMLVSQESAASSIISSYMYLVYKSAVVAPSVGLGHRPVVGWFLRSSLKCDAARRTENEDDIEAFVMTKCVRRRGSYQRTLGRDARARHPR